MNTRNIVIGMMFVLAAAVINPAIAYMSDEPGTVVDPKAFPIDSFELALMSEEPRTVVDIETIFSDNINIESAS